ncbi:hypothetical protein BDB01DRAFT_830421 [Pilobolus umbonatus]|nr:hypothetical protein BDB01DRAFT_830421 [Pilobolus umbonatus]
MSLTTVIAFALLLKKITRKGSSITKKKEQPVKIVEESIKVEEPSTDVIVRDFAYSKDSPLYSGQPLPIGLSSPDFNGREGRALFDFLPETEYELELRADQIIWVQYRHSPGWIIVDIGDQTGLVPESYVELI